MKKIRFFTEVFSMVTTCVVIAVAIFTTVLDPADEVDSVTLWQIPVVSLFCSIGCFIYPRSRTVGKREMGVRIAFHYLLTNVIVMLSGYCFHWYNIEHLGSVIVMLITIAVIFVIVSVFSWTRDAGEARLMNERLKEYQQKNQCDEAQCNNEIRIR